MDVVGSILRLDVHGIENEFPVGVLDLLGFYREPHTLEEGLQFLARSAKGMEGLAEAFTRLIQLCELRILVSDAADPPSWSLPDDGVYGPAHQIRILEDRFRTSRYIHAIRRTVRAGDVVVDLGTGSGVLAVAAAQAGAKRVYAIEARPIADAAERLFQASEVGARITLVRGLSTGVTLPERADVLVSTIIGNEPLAERILETTCDAIARLLKPGARLIPSSLRIYATPIVVPKKVRQATFFTPEVLDRWTRWYGVPLHGLVDHRDAGKTHDNLVRAFVHPWTARRWPVLGPRIALNAFDLAAQPLAPLASETTLVIERDGELGGLLVHFEADLAEGIQITTESSRVDRRTCWRSPLWLLPSVLEVPVGAKLTTRTGFRNWDSTVEIVANQS
jgi:hypothetical protein